MPAEWDGRDGWCNAREAGRARRLVQCSRGGTGEAAGAMPAGSIPTTLPDGNCSEPRRLGRDRGRLRLRRRQADVMNVIALKTVARYGESMSNVTIRAIDMGQDVVFLVTGGAAHIGAAATAMYHPEERTVRVDTLALPGHREGELAAELAEMAARSLECTVAVLAGIHLHQPTRQEIEAVVAEARRQMRQLVGEWPKQGRGRRSGDADTTR